MKYPTLEQVEAADRYQLAVWWRFLPSPGDTFIRNNGPDLDRVEEEQYRMNMEAEVVIMNRISIRFKELGFFNVEISKSIGWTPPPE
jgi:hypothetical protein